MREASNTAKPGSVPPDLARIAKGFVGPQVDDFPPGFVWSDEEGRPVWKGDPMVVHELRSKSIATFTLNVKGETEDMPQQGQEDVIAEAFEAAHEAAKRVLADHPEFLVEAEY